MQTFEFVEVFCNQSASHKEAIHQVFWLNVLNYMVVVRLCELTLLKPTLLPSTQWQWSCFVDELRLTVQGQLMTYGEILEQLGGTDLTRVGLY